MQYWEKKQSLKEANDRADHELLAESEEQEIVGGIDLNMEKVPISMISKSDEDDDYVEFLENINCNYNYHFVPVILQIKPIMSF